MTHGPMDAVLPLRRHDLERSKVLLCSLDRFFAGLGRVFVVVPDADHNLVERELRPTSPRVQKRVVAETEIVPELGTYRRVGGWYKQQLIKLAISEHIASDFYLTLDADVVATRPVSPADLVRDGRALMHVLEEDLHPLWYTRTATLLDRPMRRTGVVHNVTPAVLAREGVMELARHFDARWRSRHYARGGRQVRQRWARLCYASRSEFAAWRLFLVSALPWTEYALYYSFLEAYDRFSAYHIEHPVCLYDIERSVWHPTHVPFETWSPEALFRGRGPPFFAVFQSTTGVAVNDLREKLDPHLRDPVRSGDEDTAPHGMLERP